jgi:hypothetical protein
MQAAHGNIDLQDFIAGCGSQATPSDLSISKPYNSDTVAVAIAGCATTVPLQERSGYC